MPEPQCPLVKGECWREECLWYAAGVHKCVVVVLGIMVNNMHDMGVQSFQQFVEPVLEQGETPEN